MKIIGVTTFPVAVPASHRGGRVHELAACIRRGTQPEVDGATALRAVALVYALFESHRAGRPVTLSEVESGGVDSYQREIDSTLKVFPDK